MERFGEESQPDETYAQLRCASDAPFSSPDHDPDTTSIRDPW